MVRGESSVWMDGCVSHLLAGRDAPASSQGNHSPPRPPQCLCLTAAPDEGKVKDDEAGSVESEDDGFGGKRGGKAVKKAAKAPRKSSVKGSSKRVKLVSKSAKMAAAVAAPKPKKEKTAEQVARAVQLVAREVAAAAYVPAAVAAALVLAGSLPPASESAGVADALRRLQVQRVNEEQAEQADEAGAALPASLAASASVTASAIKIQSALADAVRSALPEQWNSMESRAPSAVKPARLPTMDVAVGSTLAVFTRLLRPLAGAEAGAARATLEDAEICATGELGEKTEQNAGGDGERGWAILKNGRASTMSDAFCVLGWACKHCAVYSF